MNTNQHIAVLLACLLLLATVSGSEPSTGNTDKGEGVMVPEVVLSEVQPETLSTYGTVPTQGSVIESVISDRDDLPQGRVAPGEKILPKHVARSSLSETEPPTQPRDQRTNSVKNMLLAVSRRFTLMSAPRSIPTNQGTGKDEGLKGDSSVEVQMTQVNTTTDTGRVSGVGDETMFSGGSFYGRRLSHEETYTSEGATRPGFLDQAPIPLPREHRRKPSKNTAGQTQEGEESDQESGCFRCCFKKTPKVKAPSLPPAGNNSVLQVADFRTQKRSGLLSVPASRSPSGRPNTGKRPKTPTPKQRDTSQTAPRKSHPRRQQSSAMSPSGKPVEPTRGSIASQPTVTDTGLGVLSDPETSLTPTPSPPQTPAQDSVQPFLSSGDMSINVPAASDLARGQSNTPSSSPPMTRTVMSNFSTSNTPEGSPRPSQLRQRVSQKSDESEGTLELPPPDRHTSAPEFDTPVASNSATSSSSSSSAPDTTHQGSRVVIPHSYTIAS